MPRTFLGLHCKHSVIPCQAGWTWTSTTTATSWWAPTRVTRWSFSGPGQSLISSLGSVSEQSPVNTQPDLVIFPVIIIVFLGNKTVKINPTHLGCDADPTSEETCFEVESCFQIRNFPVNIEKTIVKYKIMAEIYEGGKKISRVRLATNNGELAHSTEKIIQVRKNNLDGCFKELVYLKQGTIDIRSPIRFLVEYSLGLDQPSVHGMSSLK